MRKYFIPGCVGRGLDLDLRIRPAPAASGNPSGWAQAGPKWVGPSRAQVGGPKLGPSGWAQAGPKWVGPRRAQVGGPTPGPSGWAQAGPKWAQARNLGPQKIQKIKILKIQIRSAQNVGKVWISRKKSSWAHLGPSGHIFCVGRKNKKKKPIFLGGPIGRPCCFPPLVGCIADRLCA